MASFVATGAGAVTVSVALPDLPSLVAVMSAVPAATAVTRPEALTVATAEFELVHPIAWPVSTLPLESRRVAVACVLCPTVSDGAFSVTVTEATVLEGGGRGVPVGWPTEMSSI